MTEKRKLPTVVSPVGVAAFAWLSKPDTGKKYSDDKYKVTLVLPKGDAEVEEFVAMVNDAHEKARGKKKTESPVKDGDEKEKEEFKGKWLLTFKSQFQPQLLQKGSKDELTSATAPRSGDLIKVAFAMAPYEEGKNAGISLQLRAVKLMERRARADYSDVFGDDDEDEPTTKGSSGGKDDNEDF